jgi:uncharacterized DUF497 family protein
MEFEWDENKRSSNVAKHQLDLARGIDLFDGRPVLTVPSPRGDERRFVTIGWFGAVAVALVWVERDAAIRLISLRRARDAEKRAHRARFG